MDDGLAAERWTWRLRSAVLAARKARDSVRVAALRSALSAIENAGAVERDGRPAAVTEVPRRALSEQAIRDLIDGEIAEREEAATHFEAAGEAGRAGTARSEAAVLSELLTS